MSPAEVGAMFDEFVQGGLLDDADVLIKGSRFSTWDYNGKQPQPVLAIHLSMEDGEAQVHEQYLSSGELRFFVPSSDGRLAVPVGNQSKLNLNTNAVAFLLSVMNAATDADWLAKFKGSGDVSLLEGMRMHVIRKAQPKRAGIIQAPGVEGQPQREKTQLLCERIISYPGQAAPAAGKSEQAAGKSAVTATAPAAAGGAASEVDDTAVGALCTVIGENGNSMKVSAIAGKFFSSAGVKSMELPPATKNAVLGVIVKPDFLGAAGRPWTYDKVAGTVSLG